MSNIKIYKNDQQTTLSTENQLQNMEDEGGITIDSPPQEPSFFSKIKHCVKTMLHNNKS